MGILNKWIEKSQNEATEKATEKLKPYLLPEEEVDMMVAEGLKFAAITHRRFVFMSTSVFGGKQGVVSVPLGKITAVSITDHLGVPKIEVAVGSKDYEVEAATERMTELYALLIERVMV